MVHSLHRLRWIPPNSPSSWESILPLMQTVKSLLRSRMDYPPAFTVVVQWLPIPIIHLCRCLLLNVEAKTIVDISQSAKPDPMQQQERERELVQEREQALQQAQPQPTQPPLPTLPQLQHLLQLANEEAGEVEEVEEEIDLF